jgi:hypothetical protein
MKSPAFEYLNKSETILEYNQRLHAFAHATDDELSEHQKEMSGYYQLNWARSTRVDKTYSISDKGVNVLSGMKQKQIWFVITEGWCGDSSQSLPVIAKIAQESKGNIDLHIVSRDAHPALLEQYLTNGSMSIPKLIATDENGEELWVWGPRPIPATELFQSLKQQNLDKEEIYKNIHAWYAKDKGYAIEQEVMEHIF